MINLTETGVTVLKHCKQNNKKNKLLYKSLCGYIQNDNRYCQVIQIKNIFIS